jgi:hypothetical protein
MAESDASVSGHGSESSVSESLGIKTLQARSMVLASFRDPSKPNFGYSYNTCNVRGMRENLQQRQKSSSPQSVTA